MLDTDIEKPQSAIAQVKRLQEEIARLSTQARNEALAQASQAIETLNALGLPYRLHDDAARTPAKKRRSKSVDCRVCGFTTDPPHNARKHSSLGDEKRPFTDEELASLGLRHCE